MPASSLAFRARGYSTVQTSGDGSLWLEPDPVRVLIADDDRTFRFLLASALRKSECLFMSSRSLRSASFRASWAINFRAAVSMNSDRLLYSPIYKSIALSTSSDSVIDVLTFIPSIYYPRLVLSIFNSLDRWTERWLLSRENPFLFLICVGEISKVFL